MHPKFASILLSVEQCRTKTLQKYNNPTSMHGLFDVEPRFFLLDSSFSTCAKRALDLMIVGFVICELVCVFFSFEIWQDFGRQKKMNQLDSQKFLSV